MTKHGRTGLRRRQFIVGAGVAGLGGVAGCTSDQVGGEDTEAGGTDADGETAEGAEPMSGELSGDIRISGSSTVYPIGTAVSELFKEENPDVNFEISRDGSSGGFENVFIPGDADINNASRAITESEVQACQDNGFEPVEFRIAQDALTVVVNNENTWVEAMTYDDLNAIWTDENPPETWADVNDSWPSEPLDLYGPASTSGTFDYFTETINGEVGKIRDDFEGTEEDDQIATGVEGSQYALGYLPFAYYVNNPEETTALAIAESNVDEAVEPSLDAASTGEYPLARPLFFYANSERLAEKRHLQEFIRFYVNKSTDRSLIADEIGYVQSSEELAQENIDTLEEYV